MDPELFQRMQEAARRFREGESDFEEIMTPAGPAHLIRDDSDPRGFKIDFVGDGARRSVSVQNYPAAPTRPPGYPAPLPFLAGCAATVDTLDQSVTWTNPSSPEKSFEQVVLDSLDDGWVRLGADSTSTDESDLHCQALEKEGVERIVRLQSSEEGFQLVVQERRAGSDA
ncbi:MAG: hypothetical protein MK239_04560 [Gemmatimonadetes bacterium]|nr:hypothetical protein [Gemmatimonadota bacterium]|tara:strand:+ start:807 stop:1316 length:510 start_codon:yes stop_codon:yes gene_type:complete